MARNQPKVAVELPDQAGMEEEVDAIPSLLERHVRTDKKEETLHLEDQVLDLAKQRLGEGQYESASKFAKLVDKVCFFLPNNTSAGWLFTLFCCAETSSP